MEQVVITINELNEDISFTVDESQAEVDLTVVEDIEEVSIVVLGEALKGDKGDSAYDIWLAEGNEGTEEDFINSLRPFNMSIGPIAPVNPSLYDLWIDTSE
jgi:hypothetical protein